MPSPSEADAMFRTMLEANLSSEVAMIVLDVVSLYTNHFKVWHNRLYFEDLSRLVAVDLEHFKIRMITMIDDSPTFLWSILSFDNMLKAFLWSNV